MSCPRLSPSKWDKRGGWLRLVGFVLFEIDHKVNSIMTAPFTFRCVIYEDVNVFLFLFFTYFSLFLRFLWRPWISVSKMFVNWIWSSIWIRYLLSQIRITRKLRALDISSYHYTFLVFLLDFYLGNSPRTSVM